MVVSRQPHSDVLLLSEFNTTSFSLSIGVNHCFFSLTLNEVVGLHMEVTLDENMHPQVLELYITERCSHFQRYLGTKT